MPLVTRQYGPDAKNLKLSFYDMDMNLYYLQDLGVSGFSYSNGIIEISNPTGGTKDVTINIVTGFTYDNLNTFTITDNYNNNFSATINTVTGLTVNGTISATTISGGTLYGDGSNLTGISTQDTFVTGTTYSNNTFTFTNNTGGTFSVLFNTVTGLTTNGNLTVTGTTSSGVISATTYQNLPTDIRVTGGTYNGSTITFTNNTGGTFTVTGVTSSTTFTGGTVTGSTNFTNGLTANTISATTYQNLPITGTTDNIPKFTSTNSLGNSFLSENSSTLTFNTSSISNGLSMVLNSANSNASLVSFRSGGITNFDVGFDSTQNFRIGSFNVIGGFNGVALQIPKNTKRILLNGATDDGSSELQVNGIIKTNTISATTYQNLPLDITITGGTYSAGTITLLNNTGGTVSISGLSTGYTYSQTNNYTSEIPITITHNLNTTEVLIQIIDTNTNQLILANVSNYQLNSVDVTLNSSLNGIKVVIVGSSVSSVTPKGKITLLFGHDSISPADSTTYYIGGQFNLAPTTSANDGRRLISPVTGYVTQVSISETVGGSLGTSETNTLTINNVTQSTSSTITTTATYASSSSLQNYILSSQLYVVNGDKLEIRWTTPAWVTNPTTVRQQINVLIDF